MGDTFVLAVAKGRLGAVVRYLLLSIPLAIVASIIASICSIGVEQIHYVIYLPIFFGLIALTILVGIKLSKISVEARKEFEHTTPTKYRNAFLRTFFLLDLPWLCALTGLLIVIGMVDINGKVKVVLHAPITIAFTLCVFFIVFQISVVVRMKKFFCKSCGAFLDIKKSKYKRESNVRERGGEEKFRSVRVGEIKIDDKTYDVYREGHYTTPIKKYRATTTTYDYELYCPKCGKAGEKGSYHNFESYDL